MNLSTLYPLFTIDALNRFVFWAIGLFCLLTTIYSLRLIKKSRFQYYFWIFLTALVSMATVLANNFLLLLVLWGFLGVALYILVSMGKDAAATAKKTFIIVGGSDVFMLLGVGIIYYLTGSFQMDAIKLELNSGLAVSAYLCLAVACFAKAGAMPFHSWIPDCAEDAPLPVVAYLPASLDKLLGIYLLARISLDVFVMNDVMNIVLMLVGAFTIIAAVMMALVQHNMKRLLGYHAVSQVGYMVLGIGTGTPLGIAGGLFHMLNHAIYKSCLFFTSGNVEYRTSTVELDRLGDLAKVMPLTYISCLIASLAISGVPPFNGFVSKWMVYQGLFNQLSEASFALRITILFCVVAAMFGSGLTLASFMKLLHATFLGQSKHSRPKGSIHEVPWTMWLPCIVLGALCIVFGIFAIQIPLRYFIFPVMADAATLERGVAGASVLFIFIGLLTGLFLVKAKSARRLVREDASCGVGGEEAAHLEEKRVTGSDFYATIKELGFLRRVYRAAEAGSFDIYEQGKSVVFGLGKFLQYLHNGILPTYLVWTLLGMIGLFFILFR